MEDATSYHETSHYATQREHPSERLGAMRCTLAKTLNSSGHGNFHDDKPRPHPKIETLVNTIISSLTKESLQYLKGPEGEAALACVVSLVAHAASRFVVTEEAKLAIQVSAQEATTGLSDGCHRKLRELVMKVPRGVLYLGVIVVGTYGVLLAVE